MDDRNPLKLQQSYPRQEVVDSEEDLEAGVVGEALGIAVEGEVFVVGEEALEDVADLGETEVEEAGSEVEVEVEVGLVGAAAAATALGAVEADSGEEMILEEEDSGANLNSSQFYPRH